MRYIYNVYVSQYIMLYNKDTIIVYKDCFLPNDEFFFALIILMIKVVEFH